MIHVVTAANRHFYEEPIESLFRLRYQTFVEERGWNALARADRRDVDAYDNPDSVYLLAMEGPRVVGGLRLYPTVKPTIMAEHFAQLAAVVGVPCDPLIWEGSRLFVVKERREGKVLIEILTGAQELCLDEGIAQLSGVMETWWLPRFQEAGFVVRPLGLPAIVDDSWTMAVLYDISADTLAHLRSMAGIAGSILVRRGPQHSLVDCAIEARRRAVGNAS